MILLRMSKIVMTFSVGVVTHMSLSLIVNLSEHLLTTLVSSKDLEDRSRLTLARFVVKRLKKGSNEIETASKLFDNCQLESACAAMILVRSDFNKNVVATCLYQTMEDEPLDGIREIQQTAEGKLLELAQIAAHKQSIHKFCMDFGDKYSESRDLKETVRVC